MGADDMAILPSQEKTVQELDTEARQNIPPAKWTEMASQKAMSRLAETQYFNVSLSQKLEEKEEQEKELQACQ